ncbi:MAG TPA: nuclear transport factor 2 family protein [Candidatus Sulfotelmatobacter sp.]
MANTKLTTRCRVKIVCVLALAGALAVPVLAQDKDDESKVIAMESAWNQAYKARDGKALGTMLDDSIVLVNDDGTLQSKNEFLTGVHTAKLSANQQGNPESIKVRIFGNVAIATGVFRQSGFENGKAFVRRNRFVDTWIHTGNSWQCVAASATAILH